MAVFENTFKPTGNRTNTKLVVSGGMSPAEHFIVDPKLPALFHYEFGGAGQKEVVIPKGAVVGILPDAQIDYETGKSKSVLTFASDKAPAVGMAPYNFTLHTDDFFDGNQPAIITRDYVELPFGTDKAKVKKLQFGAVLATDLKIGDKVTFSKEAGFEGKIIKAAAGDQVVGQVLAMEADAQVQGWLKWVLWDEAARYEDLGNVDKDTYKAPDQTGFPFDPEYKEGLLDTAGYLSQYTTTATGVPGLLDGQQRSQTERTHKQKLLAANSVIALSDQELIKDSVELADDTSTVTFTKALSPEDLTNGQYFVDEKKGLIYYKADADVENVTVTYKAHAYGTPAHLDFDGVLGACRILLTF